MNKNIKYMLIQMLYWMAYCSCYGFASYFLVEKGYGTTVVGVITAAAGILSAVCQPLLGSLADRLGTGYKKPLLLILVALILTGAELTASSLRGTGKEICITFALIMLLLSLANPFINLAGVSFAGQINFGMARAAGSFGYALASYTIGYVSAKFGAATIPALITGIAVFTIVVTLTMPNSVSDDVPSKEKRSVNGVFFKRYPLFTLLWIVFIFLMTSHAFSNTFLLQIMEKAGGTSYELGIAVAIAAIVEMPMIFCYEKINRRISTKKLLIIAAATYLLKGILQLLNSNLFIFYLIQLLQFTSWGICASASVYIAKEIIPFVDQAQAQAYMTNSLTIGTVIATFFGGIVIDRFGVNHMIVLQCVAAGIALAGSIVWSKRVKQCD